MIKFFRKIRAQLVVENKVSKYLIYSIGEIVLVVIGILIAVQINEANNQKSNRALEIYYLKDIAKDISVDIERLGASIVSDSLKIVSGNFILENFKNPKGDNVPLLMSHFANMIPVSSFQKNDVVFDDLKSSGRLNIILNDSLRNDIQRYYHHASRIIGVLSTNNAATIDMYMLSLFDGQYDMNSVLNALGISFAESQGITEVTPFDASIFYRSTDDIGVKSFIDRLSVNIFLAQLNSRRMKVGKALGYALVEHINEHIATIE
jgi:hypothetical protein